MIDDLDTQTTTESRTTIETRPIVTIRHLDLTSFSFQLDFTGEKPRIKVDSSLYSGISRADVAAIRDMANAALVVLDANAEIDDESNTGDDET